MRWKIILILFFSNFQKTYIFYKKVFQGIVIIRNGSGGPKVSFSGIFVIPIIHQSEKMNISAANKLLKATLCQHINGLYFSF